MLLQNRFSQPMLGGQALDKDSDPNGEVSSGCENNILVYGY